METTTSPSPVLRVLQAIALVALCLLILIAFLCFFSAAWYVRIFGRIGFDSIIDTLTSGMGGVSTDLIDHYLAGAVLPTLICTVLVILPLFWAGKPLLRIRSITLFPIPRWIASLLAVALSLGLLFYAAFDVELVDYLINSNRTGALYQDEYKDPNGVTITFPEEKRNLIYIMLESMETSYLSEDLGGALPYNLIPELTQLAQDNINFSHNTSVGGFREVTGTSWTVGAMVGHTAGIHLKVPDGITDWQNGQCDAVASVEIVTDNEAVKNALISGSAACEAKSQSQNGHHNSNNLFHNFTSFLLVRQGRGCLDE